MSGTSTRGAKVTDIAVLRAQRLVREHICPFCNNTMIDSTDSAGLGFWTCPHCDFGIHDRHLYDGHLDFLAALIRTKIREKRMRSEDNG